MENKDITMNELAVMVKNGFDNVDERFNQVDERFNQVEGRLDRLESNQRAILTKLEEVVYKSELDQLKERVRIIEQAIDIKKN